MHFLIQQDHNEENKHRIVALSKASEESFDCVDVLKPAHTKLSSQNTDVNLELKKAACCVVDMKETEKDMLGFYWQSERRAKKAIEKLVKEFKLSYITFVG